MALFDEPLQLYLAGDLSLDEFLEIAQDEWMAKFE